MTQSGHSNLTGSTEHAPMYGVTASRQQQCGFFAYKRRI